MPRWRAGLCRSAKRCTISRFEGAHSYFVGDQGFWVHNICDGAAEELEVGYHATRAENVASILENGLREGLGGRAGAGVYLSSTPEGAIAEFAAHYPGLTPSVLQVGYSPGSNAVLERLMNSYIKGPLPLAADTLSFESVRLGGSMNTVVRNGSSVVLGVGN